jgi:hypothetical protein
MRKVLTTGITALGIAGASFALTVMNPFSASAQTESPSTTVPVPADPSTPTTPTTPTTPSTPEPRDRNCPDKEGDSGREETPNTSSNASPAALRVRLAR